ncbi:MAG: GerAB/ArcD/ProY family transporter [Clostridiales bacterium]|jgi:hypothetical protein|nr:GerAB/ArcD/ProY family transporter [Clostridiales bacterium]
MNLVYKRQFAVLIFFAGAAFKIAFLPAYITKAVGNGNTALIALYVLFDLLLLAAVYYIAKKNIIADLPKNFRAGMMMILFVYFAIKFAVMSGDVSYCISDNLFKDAYIVFIYAAIGALTSYIAVKGSRVTARLGEIFVALTVIGLFVNLVTAESEINFMYNLPLFSGSAPNFFEAFDKLYMWTGDYLPLIIFTLTDTKKKSKLMPYMIALTAVTVVGHYVFLNAIFKAGASAVDNLIVSLGSFNIGNILVGRTDALSLSVWFVMAVINLSVTMLAATECASYFLKDRRIGTAAVNVFTVLLYIFGFKNINKLYGFATGQIRYFILAAEILVPAAIIIAYLFKKKKEKTARLRAFKSGMPKEIAAAEQTQGE